MPINVNFGSARPRARFFYFLGLAVLILLTGFVIAAVVIKTGEMSPVLLDDDGDNNNNGSIPLVVNSSHPGHRPISLLLTAIAIQNESNETTLEDKDSEGDVIFDAIFGQSDENDDQDGDDDEDPTVAPPTPTPTEPETEPEQPETQQQQLEGPSNEDNDKDAEILTEENAETAPATELEPEKDALTQQIYTTTPAPPPLPSPPSPPSPPPTPTPVAPAPLTAAFTVAPARAITTNAAIPEGFTIPLKQRLLGHVRHPCVKFNFYVKPSEIGQTQIIAPQLLDLGYCGGTCPFPLMSDSINHTLHGYFLDQFKLHELSPYLPARSCCVPVAYKDIMVLMRDDNGAYVPRTLPNASVTHCGCR